jgi:hypothetical protein
MILKVVLICPKKARWTNGLYKLAGCGSGGDDDAIELGDLEAGGRSEGYD